jgi:hypothetical protein
MKKLRVIVDFHEPEQKALEALCRADYRLPDDQIRWMVITAAAQRGLFSLPNANSDTARQGPCVAVAAA